MDSYRRLSKREIYRNPWVAVEAHEIVHPTGVPGEHVLIVTPPASAVLVVDGEDVILARQPRFGAREEVVEVVKGGADDGESPLACAQRELREELGLVAESWVALGITFEIPSLVDKPVAIFAASQLHEAESAPENIERISLVRLGFEEAYTQALDGRINDAVTLVALARYGAIRAERSSRSTDIPAR